MTISQAYHSAFSRGWSGNLPRRLQGRVSEISAICRAKWQTDKQPLWDDATLRRDLLRWRRYSEGVRSRRSTGTGNALMRHHPRHRAVFLLGLLGMVTFVGGAY